VGLQPYSPPASAATVLVNWPVEKVVAEIPDIRQAAAITTDRMIFRMLLSPYMIMKYELMIGS
jgi:hypothetical protein